jgi:hypothetical protein
MTLLGKQDADHHVLEHEKYDNEGNVDSAHGPNDAPDWPQYRFRRSVEKHLHAGQRRAGLHPEPTQEGHGKHDEPEVQFNRDSSQAKNIH